MASKRKVWKFGDPLDERNDFQKRMGIGEGNALNGKPHHGAVQLDETIFEIDGVTHHLTGTEDKRESDARRVMEEKFPEARISVGREIRGM